MPRVGGGQFAGGNLQNSQPHRHKHFFVIACAYGRVGILQNLRRRLAHLGVIGKNDFGRHHKERGGNALAGDVRYHHAEMVAVHQEEIVEVTADFFCRRHCGINIKFRTVRKRRKGIWQHTRLHFRSQRQLCYDTFLLSGRLGEIFDIRLNLFLHAVDRTGERANLVFIAYRMPQFGFRHRVFGRKARRFV